MLQKGLAPRVVLKRLPTSSVHAVIHFDGHSSAVGQKCASLFSTTNLLQFRSHYHQ